MDTVIYVLALFSLFWGWLLAFCYYKIVLRRIKRSHYREIRATRQSFYSGGWSDALAYAEQSESQIRTILNRP